MEKDLKITPLLEAASAGEEDAANKLFELVYVELGKLARKQMQKESSDHTLQSTALVHEVWLKLISGREQGTWKNQSHFFAAAASAMRRILVDSARARKRLKRGGNQPKFELRDDDLITSRNDELLALDEALQQLYEFDETKAKLVELRYFGGLTNQQAADQLEISTATAERYWVFAKAWLRNKIDEPG